MSDPGRMAGHIGIPGQQQFMPAFSAGSLPVGRQPLPKQLTAAIKACSSMERLSQLYHAHQAVLNPIHIAAMITKLPKLDNSMHNAAMAGGSDLPWMLSTASAQQLQLRQLLQQLLMRLKVQGCDEYSPRGVANILWALAKLQCAPDLELRHMLLDKFCSQLPTAVPQDISNVLWGVAKLTKERTAALTHGSAPTMSSAPAVLQPMGMGMLAGGSLSSPSSGSSPSLTSSALSAQDWGMMGLHALGGPADPSLTSIGGAPLLAQDQVRLLLQHLCQQLHTASVQTISNSLWAVVVLQQEHQWCMCNCLDEVQSLLEVFCKQPLQALPGHIQPVIRCMAQLATTCSNHAGDSWIKWQPGLLQQLLDYLNSQRKHMEMHHVSSVLRDVAQVVCLHLLLAKQTRSRQQQGSGGAAGRGNSYSNACMPAGSEHSSSGRGSPSSSSRRPGTAGTYPHAMSLNTISVEEEAEEVLARLAATGGPQDASSTVVALAMLQPQLEQLGLQQGVAGLCSLLPPAALPQLGEEVGQRLLAAASATPAARAAAGSAASGLQVVLPEQQFAALPPAVVGTPSAAPGSSSASNSSGSNVVLTGSGPEAGGSLAQQQSPQHVQLPDASSPAGAAAAAGLAGSCSSPGAAAAVCLPGNSSDSLRSHGSSIAGGEPASEHATAMLQQRQQQPGSTGAAAEGGCGGCTGDDGCTCPGSCNAADPHQSGLVSPAVSVAETPAAADLRPGSSSAEGGALSPGVDSQEEAAARQLTHNIAYADSVYQLAEIFNGHSSVMDMIHITACITRLSKVLGTTPSATSQAAAAALLPLLGSKLLQVLPHANARGIANVLWGYGRLRNLPQSDLLPALLEAFLRQLPTAACRDSAVVLWSLARLTEGQGIAPVGVQTELLQRLGRAVLRQLASAATAAMTPPPPPSQQQQEQAGAGTAVVGSSSPATRPDAAAAGAGGGGSSSETSAAPSSRDISNSLMALTRLGFVPETAEESAAEDSKESAEAATAAAAGAGVGAGLAEQLASRQGSGSHAAAAAAAAAAAQLEGLTVQQASAAGPEASSEALQQQQQQQQSPRPAGAARGEQLGTPQQQQQPAEAVVRLTLPLKPVQVIVKFLLHHAATAKTLDLQEAATALKQLGLQELHALVSAAIVAPHGGGVMGLSPLHAAGGPQRHHAAQYIHHMAAAAAAGAGAGGGSPLVPGMARFGGPGSRGGVGAGCFVGHASSILARQRQSSGGAGPGHPAVSSVGMPSSINLSGTQLAGLLQQQRRQQPLPVTGPAYGAGWLGVQQHGAGSGDHPQFPVGGRGGGHQQQQYRVFVPGGGGGGSSSPGMQRASAGPQLVSLAGPDAPGAGAGVYQQGGYPAPPAAGGVLEYPGAGGYQQQQFGGQMQYQARPAVGGQRQQQQQWAVPMPPMRQQPADMMAQQQQQPQSFVAGGVQYMFVPQHMQQQQQQPGSYILQQPQQQQQPEYVMMQMMQPAGGAGQQQQQPQPAGSAGGQVYMVPASMGSMVNIGMPVASMSGQQALAGPAMMGPASNEVWMGQAGAQVVASSGQQQQPQLQMLQMPAAGAAGMGGQYAAAGGAGAGYQVGPGALMQVDTGAAAQMGAGSFAAVNLESGGQPQQQMQQLYNVMPAGQFQQQQQQGLGVQQEPPGLFVQQQLQQQQQQQDNLQQLPVMYMDPTTGYTFQGGQFSQ